MSHTLTVAEVATLLNVTPRYVLQLIADSKLRATTGTDGRRAVDRDDAEAYRLQAKERGRKALEELCRVTQKADAYKKQE
ncbi:DNA binding domain-containing protein, excisionase family [Burkholderia sp. WP9]|uniref:excisionase family DNA-binding protein n=1 Tax=Burkholderia sp. WP9 TaxID=1500263 RepID=UPI000895E802|nr:excisionase family DNA-binding protein [Burkholderia sp. WP9]SEB92197.1 DNA binding domain-containing protein, excisionase family [Burkholderia sp. WP9]